MAARLKNKELDAINRQYILVEGNEEEHWEVYHEAADYYRALSPHLSVEEVIDGFLNGTIMLQRNLSGHMVNEQFFDEAYIPVMIDSITKDRLSNNSHFLHFLSRKLPVEEMRDLILVSLESKISQVRNVALQLVSHHKIAEAEDKAREMLNDPELFVRDSAKRAVESLGKTNNFHSE
ncbi:MAG: hypothetical protein DWQ07_19640 [Chloroflexi bacterium]|nr:MAG: hypothetical protein DWQ07_19640 [Chloroflexota bacterium]MBL1194296.1 hypothetical protein [Chloroflexota bacterium]NOH11586.1 hypothetical protein [Chloroflexota bacterium]